ncbi:histidine kinase [Larkinella ripae]
MNSRFPNDTGLRIVGIGLLIAMSFLRDGVFQEPLTSELALQILFNCVSITLTWHLNRAIIAHFRTSRRPQTKSFKRLAITFVCCVSATTLFSWFIDSLQYGISHGTLADFRHNDGSFQLSFGSTVFRMNVYGLDFFHAIILVILYQVIYELYFNSQDSSRYRQELERAEQEKEKLRVANLQSQLDVLKQQVNPHFLFNSLNSLSSLISEDPKQAEQFVDKLSGVYRYVLRANDEHLTTLATELRFIDSYYHLLQTRYGAGLSLTIAVDEPHQTAQLPPLTLQLLVENAVKHNVVSAKKPLTIQITIDEQGLLVVQNTLQRKASRALSNGVGLTNIVAKYQMLNLPPPSVEESPERFTVRLALLADAALPK